METPATDGLMVGFIIPALSGMRAPVLLEKDADIGTHVRHVLKKVRPKTTSLHRSHVPFQAEEEVTNEMIGESSDMTNKRPTDSGSRWTTEDFISAHSEVIRSGVHNFEGCRIPIPTSIRYDNIRAALGEDANSKDLRTLELLKYGFPIDCKSEYGVKTAQKNHQSALRYKEAIGTYFEKK